MELARTPRPRARRRPRARIARQIPVKFILRSA
jgi:hypothetical protein